MKVTVDLPQITDYETASKLGSYLRWVQFDDAPNVALGEVYRTFYVGPNGLASAADAGWFRALWVDGHRVLVAPEFGWTPTNGHVVFPRGYGWDAR